LAADRLKMPDNVMMLNITYQEKNIELIKPRIVPAIAGHRKKIN